jgi:hypothetical protein
MKKWLLRLAYAAAVLVPIAAAADYLATPGGTSTVFAFLCSGSKICPAMVLIDSTNVEKATAGNPLRVDPTGTTTQPVSPGTAAAWGIGTSTYNSALATNGQLALGQFQTSPGAMTTTNMSPLQLDSTGNLRVNVVAGGAGGGAVTAVAGAYATGSIVDLGTQADAACPTDNGVCSLIALTKRGNQNVAGSVAAGTNVIGKVGIDQTTPGTTNGVALVGINGATALAGNGVTGTGSARVTIASDNSALPAAGQGATAATAPSGATQGGCRAASTDPTAVTDGQMAGVQCSLSGKQIVQPYAIKELQVRGTVTTTGSGAATILTTTAGSVKYYITGVQCWNTSATAITVLFNDVETTGSGTTLFLPAAGGNNAKFDVPLVTAVASAFTFTPSGAQTTIGCNAQGYTGL